MKLEDLSIPEIPYTPQKMRSPHRSFHLFCMLCVCAILASGFTACSSKDKAPAKKTTAQAPVIGNKLPKPAPMRVAQDTNNRRKPPMLPKTIDKTPVTPDASALASEDFSSSSETKTVQSTTPKFINNEQPQDFFQGAGDVPAGNTMSGTFFDPVFRPANPPSQPVSSTSYTTE
jgi:hypothetical protein